MRKRGTALSNIMDIIAKETNGKSYKTFKYTYEGSDVLSFAYDDHQEITWERYGETVPPNGSINLKRKADSIANDKPLFGFFLDGSRHTYKVDDIAYKNKVYPVIAGQVGVSCCQRIDKVSLSNYVLYNFEDKPLELYWRLKLNVDLCEELGISIYSFPMKYHPIEDPEYFSNRDYIGLYWNRKFIRTIPAVLNSTKGKVGKGKEFFEKAFGSNDDEFNKLLLMPEAMIIYRFYFEEIGLTDEWWEHYSALTEIQKGIVNPIIYSNIFDEYEETVEDEDCLKVLSYYRIRREDAESAIKGKFS